MMRQGTPCLCARQTPVVVLLLSAALLACGGGPVEPSDSDAAVDASDSRVVVAPLEIPWLAEGAPPVAPPVLTPCPDGWHEVALEDPGGGIALVTCDPYNGIEPAACPYGWTHFVGDMGCTPVGAPCPAGDFPEGLPDDAEVLYVLSSAALGGDGSREAPLVLISDALNLASRGTVVAIGKGQYDDALRLPPGVTLWGACAAETRLTASSPGALAQGVITVPSADTHLVNLRIGPAELPGLVAYGAAASVTVDGLMIEGVRRSGLFALMGARISGRELVVSGTRGDAAGHFGRGVVVSGASTVDLQRVSVSRNHEIGVSAQDEGTLLTLADVVLCDTQAEASGGAFGRGLSVQFGATATVSRALLSGNRDVAVFVGADGASLTLTDVVVRDTEAQESDGMGGGGLAVQSGAALTVVRGVLSRNRDVAVFAGGEGAALTLTDVVVHDSLGRERDGAGGRGIGVQLGATAAVSRGLFAGSRDLGVFVAGAGASLSLVDVVVRDTQAQESDGAGGRGLNLQEGARVDVRRALFSRNRDIGVFADGEGSLLTLMDVVVHDTQGQESDGTEGRGLNVQRGAAADVTRAVLSHNRGFGVSALGRGATVGLLDVAVMHTAEHACAAASCVDHSFGVGLAGAHGATLEVTRFQVEDAVLCGVLVAESGQVDLSMGQVSDSQVGVCLQVEGYSVARLTDGVRYFDNGTNLDATSLPVPEVVSPVDAAR